MRFPPLAAIMVAALWSAGCTSSSVVGGTPDASVDAVADIAVDRAPTCGEGQLLCDGRCVAAADDNNCGACGQRCTGSDRCMSGRCQTACPSWQQACPLVGDGGAQVCVLLPTDNSHCGACGRRCGPGEVCSNGSCSTSCQVGLETCTSAGGERRCAMLATDPLNCGACNTACGAGRTCEAGRCVVTCLPGATVCGATDGGVGVCALGACGFVCAAGFGDCNASRTDGCEVALSSTAAHCGACGNACPVRANATTTCAGSVCGYTCDSNFGDCDGAPANGCEVDLRTSAAHCRRCDNVCGSGLICMAGSCAGSCSGVAGPTLVNNIGGWPTSGMQFRALRNATITSVRFQNQGQGDTIRLTDGSGNTLATVSVPAGNPSFTFTPNWTITAGVTYRVLSDLNNNGRWVDYSSFATVNTQIAVDGVFGMGALHPVYWFSFTNIQTCDR